MCSLGHHEDRPPRRHTDGSVTAAVRALPRAELARRLADTTAQLRAEIEEAQADALVASFGMDDAEPLAQTPDLFPTSDEDLGDKQSRKHQRSRAFLTSGEVRP